MPRLAGSDAGFLFIESPTMSSTCIDIAELGMATDGRGPLTLRELQEHVAARLDAVPPLRWRLEEVPLGLAHPVWIDDPDFDLEYHLREITVDAPGSDADLDRLVAERFSPALDLRHPPWQIVLVHGLTAGRQALVFRFHHATADGLGLIATLTTLFGPPAGEEPVDPHGRRPVPPAPTRARLLGDGLWTQLRALLGLPRLLLASITRFWDVEKRRKQAPVEVPRAANDAPRTVLNDSHTADRAFARTRLNLPDLRRVKAASGAGMNDVVLAVVAGALRRHLEMLGELPERSLVVNVPVSLDPPDAPVRYWGNHFSNFFALLHTEIDDPRERLEAISRNTDEARLQLEILGTDTLPSWLDRIPPAVAAPAARWMTRRHRDPERQPDFNVLVSNVRLSAAEWSIGTRPVTRVTMSGPVADGAGVNITVTGWDPFLDVAITTNPDAVPNPDQLAALMRGALAELVGAFVEPTGAADVGHGGDTASPAPVAP